MSSEPAVSPAAAPEAAEAKPIDGIALAKEVVLERLENLLAWLLIRLRRYRERREMRSAPGGGPPVARNGRGEVAAHTAAHRRQDGAEADGHGEVAAYSAAQTP